MRILTTALLLLGLAGMAYGEITEDDLIGYWGSFAFFQWNQCAVYSYMQSYGGDWSLHNIGDDAVLIICYNDNTAVFEISEWKTNSMKLTAVAYFRDGKRDDDDNPLYSSTLTRE